jgi:hypothetical protein
MGRLKQLKQPVWVLKDPATEQYIALADESRAPHLAPLHLATLRPGTPAGLADLAQLASRRLSGVPHCAVRVDAL